MSLAYVILDLVFSEYAMKGIFQYSVKRTLVVLKIDDDNETKNVQVRAQRPYQSIFEKKILSKHERTYIWVQDNKFPNLGPA